ncbi:hypothetical protein CR513_53660, partial [Mucuna pruriens]
MKEMGEKIDEEERLCNSKIQPKPFHYPFQAEQSKQEKQIPKYAKFLKDICINKRKKLNGGVEVGRNVSALIKSKQVSALIQLAMPKKCSDPDTFSIPCIAHRLMSCFGIDWYSDLTSKLEHCTFAWNFGGCVGASRPFLKTTRIKIYVHVGTLSMEFGDNRVEYIIFEAMKHPQRTIQFSIWM